MILWHPDQMIDELREDGLLRVCPNGSSPSTAIDYVQSVREQVIADAEKYIPQPNISLAPLEFTIPPTVNSIEDAAGAAIFNGQPLRVVRGADGHLTLRGRSFPDDPLDLITFPPGVVSDFDATTDADGLTIDLDFTIDPAAIRGIYDIEFNDRPLRGVLMVR